MRRNRFCCALLPLFFAVASEVQADVGFSYIADQSSYSGVSGSFVSVKLYLVESVTSTGSNQTSVINNYFANADFSITYSGVASVGVGVEQTGLSNGGAVSQILGPSIFTPNVAYNGVSNNAGFAFGPDFTYHFNQNTSSFGTVPMIGGGNMSQLYQNLDDPITGFNGNNIQVKAALGTTDSIHDYSVQRGVLTDASYDATNDVYGSGKILIGTLAIAVGQGTTTFQVKPLAQTTLTANASTTFNGIPLGGAFGSAPGTVTPLSGSGGNASTTLAVTVFGGVVDLGQSYLSATRPSSAAFNSFQTINSPLPTAGPSATPATPSSLPFFTGATGTFVFSVSSVPEPSSIALTGLLAACGAFLTRRRAA